MESPGYLADGAVVSATGSGRISGAARQDFAAAAAAVLQASDDQPHIYELGGPPFTLDEFAEAVTTVTGTRVVHRNLSQDEFIADRQTAGVPTDLAHMMAGIDASIAAGEMYTDSTALAELIGHAPITLLDSIRRTV